ncbi:hypothetical protein C8Q80DRAFT_1270265 [Daedaleopsis nitida]|nr:hypothetical protein C8Q80DRAFT_1270265 [Daedaleopsis nitida]
MTKWQLHFRKVLHDLLPNETSVWRSWRQTTLDRIVKCREPGVPISHPTGNDLKTNLVADADAGLDFYNGRLQDQQALLVR